MTNVEYYLVKMDLMNALGSKLESWKWKFHLILFLFINNNLASPPTRFSWLLPTLMFYCKTHRLF